MEEIQKLKTENLQALLSGKKINDFQWSLAVQEYNHLISLIHILGKSKTI
jgi:hypothetical protein